MHPSYVYLIGGDECPRVKIGHSKSPEHRLAEFKTGFPYRMRALWRHGGGSRLEYALHKRFERQHREGEWFGFGEADAVAAVSTATAELWDGGAIDGNVQKDFQPPSTSTACSWLSWRPGAWKPTLHGPGRANTYQGSSQAQQPVQQSMRPAKDAAIQLEDMAIGLMNRACHIPKSKQLSSRTAGSCVPNCSSTWLSLTAGFGSGVVYMQVPSITCDAYQNGNRWT
ncbi:GIY-YIG nuclease family protein [Nonomuraea sp. NPDC049158]|uniref:GIY-YIG nuclease family protein n=1 Tax=Nonomuraea sp. NPDC049158 TaxID=3155649 RepID=UPI0033E1B461